jgi:predicted RNA-binding Zn ribbon-like protein
VKFGNRRGGGGDKLGKLCVFKFLDTNGSRRQDFGELPLSGWTFEVRDTAGNVVATLVTDAQGGFCTAVPAGVYTVTETPQVGYTPTTPPTQTITVPAGQSVTAVFGNRQTGEVGLGKLCVFKFHDTDGSRRQDPGELPLSGWTFDVRDAAGTSVATLTTDAQGWFCTAMPAGTYTVTETPQAGYTPTTPTTQTVTVIAGQSITATFGNRKGDKPGDEGQLCIHKFLDENGTGKQDPGETSLGGWIFQVRNAAGVVATLTSDARRDVCTRLPAGTYTVTETPQTGYTATTPTTQPATVVAGQSTTVIFGNRKGDTPGGEGQLCIHKFLDENRNGRQDLGEAALGGFTFQVRNAAGVVTTLMSDARRDVCTRLPAGTYAITETPLTGYTPTTPTTQTATVTAGQTTTVTFGNRKGDQPGGEGQLCVHKFLDENGNGIQDAGELALAGWTFEVRNAAGAVVAKLTTDGKGNACTRLSAGAYTVTEVPLPGYTPTTPPTQSVTVTPNRTTDATFGNRKGGR